MRAAQTLAEVHPRIRWHVSRLWTALVLRRAFAELGPRTVIVSPLRLRGVDTMRIGADCAIYEGAWLQCEHSHSTLTIGAGCYFGHASHLHAVDAISIGDACVFADGVLVSSSDHGTGDRHSVTNTGAINIGDRVFIGQRAMVLGGVTIGSDATIGAGAVVTHDVPAGATVADMPARPLGGRRP